MVQKTRTNISTDDDSFYASVVSEQESYSKQGCNREIKNDVGRRC